MYIRKILEYLKSYFEEEISLEKLRDDDLTTFQNICQKLNSPHSGSNWKNLLEVLFEKDHISHCNYEQYEKYYHGGESAACLWLKELGVHKPKLTVGSLKKVAVMKARNDIVEHLKNFKDEGLLADVKDSNLKKLSDLLDKNLYGTISDWRDFAAHYGMKADPINYISQKKLIPGIFSPTKMLLCDVIIENEKFSLISFISCLRVIKRNDVIRLVVNSAKKSFRHSVTRGYYENENENETEEDNDRNVTAVQAENDPMILDDRERPKRFKDGNVRPHSLLQECLSQQDVRLVVVAFIIVIVAFFFFLLVKRSVYVT